MSFMRLIALLDTSHGPPYSSRDDGVVADNLKGIRIAMLTTLFVVNSSCIHTCKVPLNKKTSNSVAWFRERTVCRNPEDWSLVIMEATQYVPLYMTSHTARPNPAGAPSCFCHSCDMAVSGTICIPVALVDNASRESRYWLSVNRYGPAIPTQTLMTNWCRWLHSNLSVVSHELNASGHVLIWTFFVVLVCETRAKICPHLSVTPNKIAF
jgi:hypothetical protein